MNNPLKNAGKHLKAMGFSYRDGIYYRVINDMLQNVELRHLRIRKEYRIEFGVMPLCALISDIYQGCCSFSLSDFYALDYPEWYEGWTYLHGGDEKKQECRNAIDFSVQKYLLPFFVKCQSSKSAYETYRDAQIVQNHARLLWLKKRNCEDRASKDDVYFDPGLLYLSLKNGQYDFAVKAFEVQNSYDENICSRFEKDDFYSENIVRRKEDVAIRQKWIGYLKNGQYEKMQDVLTQREKISIDYLNNFSTEDGLCEPF